MAHHTRRRTGRPRWNMSTTLDTSSMGGTSQKPYPIMPLAMPQKKSMKMAWTLKYPKAAKMARRKQTAAPTSLRMGLGWLAAFFRPAEALFPEVPVRLPEEDAVRFPPVLFFCAVAMDVIPFRRVW